MIYLLFICFIIVFFALKSGRGNDTIKEFEYLNVYDEVFFTGKPLFNLRDEMKICGKCSPTCVVIGSEKLMPKVFRYAIVVENNKFVKYMYPKVPMYKSLILDNKGDNPFNPKVVIKQYDMFNVIREDVLPGGTKQRGLFWYAQDIVKAGFNEIAYAGPAQGVAQAAMGVISKYFKIPAHMFYSGKPGVLSNRARGLGVIMHEINGGLADCKHKAIEWSNMKKNRFLIPFGLDDGTFKEYLVIALRRATKHLNMDQKHVWLVGGSGVLISVLYHVFPKAYFHLIQVGKTIWGSSIDEARTQVFVHPDTFNTSAREMPEYPSISNYDAKVWYYAKKYGKPGDYIWNVAG